MGQRENNFWKGLKKPIIGLAPMDGVTDAAMRFIVKKYGNPDVMFTEFTNVEGIRHAVKTNKWSPEHRLARNFKYDESQRPIVAQIFGKDPESFRVAAKLMVELGFDGVDINMGCPAKNVSEHGSGAALIGQPELAGEIIKATLEGVGGKIPVSVKTRTGVTEPVTLKWIEHLLQFDLAAITLHGRTLKQMYQGLADWEEIGKAAKLIKESKKEIIFLGNGDIQSCQQAAVSCQQYGVDGVLMGRAAMGTPWIFDPNFKFEVS
jgi:nifR3 family TIM-barrel protein